MSFISTIAARRRPLSRRWMRHPALLCGGAILFVILCMAIFAPLITDQSPYEQDLLGLMTPPVWEDGGSWDHLFGTDQLGRDYLARILYGARISLFIGITAALISGLIGTSLGVLAGYFGGKVDVVISFIITARLAMPVILVALAVVATVGSSLTIVITVLGLLMWDRYALVMRATTQQIRSMDFVTAAHVQGCSARHIMFHEVFPNLANNLVVVATLEIGHAIILEAALSFLGLGVPPPMPSWGRMVADGKSDMLFDPWLIMIPGVMLFLLILSINLVGDSLRDVTSPEGRN